VASDRVWFVAERFERLTELLMEFGYAIDPGPRDPNEWQEQHVEDPPTGLVRLKAVRLGDPNDPESDFDPDITFSVRELWSAERVDQATDERGFYRIAYSYHAHSHGVDQRWDFDPLGHPDLAYHHHPPHAASDDRGASDPTSPREALEAFESWLARTR